jgi:hypothetical protein
LNGSLRGICEKKKKKTQIFNCECRIVVVALHEIAIIPLYELYKSRGITRCDKYELSVFIFTVEKTEKKVVSSSSIFVTKHGLDERWVETRSTLMNDVYTFQLYICQRIHDKSPFILKIEVD